MSYPRSLDEMPESELIAEIERRIALRRAFLCDYCARRLDMPPCRFPERHALPYPGRASNPVDHVSEWLRNLAEGKRKSTDADASMFVFAAGLIAGQADKIDELKEELERAASSRPRE